MLHRLAADGVLLVHFAFVLFVVLGGFLVLRFSPLAWLHLPTVGWAAFVEFTGRICPLTPLEVALRQAAGDAGYAGDFLEHYLVALMYPEGLTRGTQVVLGGAVLLVNAVVYALVLRRLRRRRPSA